MLYECLNLNDNLLVHMLYQLLDLNGSFVIRIHNQFRNGLQN